MPSLVPLIVRIGLKQETGTRSEKPSRVHAYPDFNSLPIVQSSGMDWSNYVDIEGLGWHYDQCCGHEIDHPDSPVGAWNGLLLVPKQFADEAVALFPSQCRKVTEAQCQAFWETHATSQMPDEDIDPEILQGIEIKQRLNLPLTLFQQRAIDPDDDTPGIRRNRHKNWADFKQRAGLTIQQ